MGSSVREKEATGAKTETLEVETGGRILFLTSRVRRHLGRPVNGGVGQILLLLSGKGFNGQSKEFTQSS